MTEETTPQPSEAQPTKTPRKITAKEINFCYRLLEGMTVYDAAKDSGFAENTAKGGASTWIREDRDRSRKPHLWDYFQNLLKDKLRLHDITIENVLNELKIIGFSDLSHFIEIPTREDIKREAQVAREADYTSSTDDVFEWKKYRPGQMIKLKPFEEIPKQLLPAIAELRETKDGLVIKLHNKLEALEKLCKYVGMYNTIASDPDEIGSQVKEITLIVEGSRSPLMKLLEPNLPTTDIKAAS